MRLPSGYETDLGVLSTPVGMVAIFRITLNFEDYQFGNVMFEEFSSTGWVTVASASFSEVLQAQSLTAVNWFAENAESDLYFLSVQTNEKNTCALWNCPKKPFHYFLSAEIGGQLVKDANIDVSTSPTEFSFKALAHNTIFEHLVINFRALNVTDWGLYGGLNLTTGYTIAVQYANSNSRWFFDDPNVDWGFIKTQNDCNKFGGKITFYQGFTEGYFNAVIPMKNMKIDRGDRLYVLLQDDFSALLEHSFAIYGHYG